MGKPDILQTKGEYNKETAEAYDEKVTQKMNNEKEENTETTQKEIENLKILSVSKIIKAAIYDEKVTKSAYQFTDQETYTNTNFMDKTDTYINMNTSFRYIKYNIGGAGTLYNQLNEGNDFKKDSPKKVFETLKNRFVKLWYNKKENEKGKFEEFDIQNDQDILYVIGFFQAITENKTPNASKKDFRIGPKTLTALLDNNNTLTYTQESTSDIEEETPVIGEKTPENLNTEKNSTTPNNKAKTKETNNKVQKTNTTEITIPARAEIKITNKTPVKKENIISKKIEDEVFTEIESNNENNISKKEIRNWLTEEEKTTIKEMFTKTIEYGDIGNIIAQKNNKILEGFKIILIKKILLLKEKPEENKDLITFLQAVSRSLIQIESSRIQEKNQWEKWKIKNEKKEISNTKQEEITF